MRKQNKGIIFTKSILYTITWIFCFLCKSSSSSKVQSNPQLLQIAKECVSIFSFVYGACINFLKTESSYLSICKHIQASSSYEGNQRGWPSSILHTSNHLRYTSQRKATFSLIFVFLLFCLTINPLQSELGPKISIRIESTLVANDLHADTSQLCPHRIMGQLIIALIIDPSPQPHALSLIWYFWKLTFHHVPFPPDSPI